MLPLTAEILKYKRKDLEHSLSHFPIVSSPNWGAEHIQALSDGPDLGYKFMYSPDFPEIAACLLEQFFWLIFNGNIGHQNN